MNWQTTLSQAGYRLSEPRKRVMQLLLNDRKPLTPLAIHHTLMRQGIRLGVVSVYRALALLASLGLVTVVYQPDGSAGYVTATKGHIHHILCQKCYRTLEFVGSEDLTTLFKRVEAETSFKVNDHLFQLYGVCPECQTLADGAEQK